ncbi:hypothetical protein [Azorhizobium doebereinerae]|uniref:hypothetical protein n=1 Tax=Azorhizobium doebereinerae TaxID=281091 RepID=UPI0012EB8423|nr:hypothetical protein [Azorhizobium doebereinerae]
MNQKATRFEEEAGIVIALDPRFPIEDVKMIGARLNESQALVPGFNPPTAGITSLEALLYARHVERTTIVVLPDRNVVSRMARAARDGVTHPVDGPTQIAIDLMALSQAMNFDVEPSIAFHELAHHEGNAIANAELRWFHAANHGQAEAWIQLALGRTNQLPKIELGSPNNLDLAAPLHRWRCNYAVALRVAALELGAQTPLERAAMLLNWMVSDFIVAGPAAIFAAMFLSPRASRAGMLKQLKSPDRTRAIAGVRNAAWDITHLSDFVRRVKSTDYPDKRFILATADRALAQLGKILFTNAENLDEFEEQLAMNIEPWWENDATMVAKLVSDAIAAADKRCPPEAPAGIDDYVGHWIAAGEHEVTSWPPR